MALASATAPDHCGAKWSRIWCRSQLVVLKNKMQDWSDSWKGNFIFPDFSSSIPNRLFGLGIRDFGANLGRYSGFRVEGINPKRDSLRQQWLQKDYERVFKGHVQLQNWSPKRRICLSQERMSLVLAYTLLFCKSCWNTLLCVWFKSALNVPFLP